MAVDRFTRGQIVKIEPRDTIDAWTVTHRGATAEFLGYRSTPVGSELALVRLTAGGSPVGVRPEDLSAETSGENVWK